MQLLHQRRPSRQLSLFDWADDPARTKSVPRIARIISRKVGVSIAVASVIADHAGLGVRL